MFCSTCGTAVSPDLNYCNRCGTEIDKPTVKESDTLVESLIWGIVCLTIAGMGVIIGLMAVMKNVVGFSTEVILFITMAAFFLILIADITFIGMLLKRIGSAGKAEKNKRLNQSETQNVIEMPARASLKEGMPVPSVVEHTTRNLEAVERK